MPGSSGAFWDDDDEFDAPNASQTRHLKSVAKAREPQERAYYEGQMRQQGLDTATGLPAKTTS